MKLLYNRKKIKNESRNRKLLKMKVKNVLKGESFVTKMV